MYGERGVLRESMYKNSGQRRMVTEAHPVYIGKEALERTDSEELRATAADRVSGIPGFTRLSL